MYILFTVSAKFDIGQLRYLCDSLSRVEGLGSWHGLWMANSASCRVSGKD